MDIEKLNMWLCLFTPVHKFPFSDLMLSEYVTPKMPNWFTGNRGMDLAAKKGTLIKEKKTKEEREPTEEVLS